jgi:hypothetical protein
MAPFMLLPTMCVEFVIAVESLPTKATLRMPFESTLIDRTRIVIAKLLMPPQLLLCEKLVLVCEDFFIPCAQITHGLLMLASNMTMKIGPA